MKPHYQDASTTIYLGDALLVLRGLDASSIQTCITSPPYWGLRDYGVPGQLGLEKTPEEYVSKLADIFDEVKRVLMEDGTLWLNLGDTYSAQRWTKDSPQKMNKMKDLHRGLAPEKLSGLPDKNLVGIPWRVAFELQRRGWYLRQDIIWAKPNPMPESVTDRCTKSHEYIFLLSKSAKYYFDHKAIMEPCASSSATRWSQDIENQAGFSRVPGKTNGQMKAVGGPASWKGSTFTHGKTAEHQLGRAQTEMSRSGNKERKPRPGQDVLGRGHQAGSVPWEGLTRNKRDVWAVTTKPFKDAHFATFPPDLIEPCILAGCPAGGVVLDPFMGAGTTAMVVQKHGRMAWGCEMNEAYIEMAAKRLKQQVLL